MATPNSFFVTDGNPKHPAQIIGYLAERDNLNERLVFHWNPTSFKFKKGAEYESIATKSYFVESLSFKGSKALECTFELFLNEWDQPRAIQRSTEASIGWLVNRMGPTQKGVSPGGNWLDAAARAVQNHANQTQEPPVLVMVGLRDVFTCVITDLEITSMIQRPNIPPRNSKAKVKAASLAASSSTGQKIKAAALARTAGGGTYAYNRFNKAVVSAPKPGDIVRATLQVTLKEFIPAQI